MTRQDLRQRGHSVRKDLGIAAPTQPDVLPGFDDLMAEVAYGGIWDRPHLSKHDRMICTLAVCSPYLRPQLATLIGSALDIGVTPLAMLEVFLQAGLYGGFVTTEAASAVARRQRAGSTAARPQQRGARRRRQCRHG
jgi:4-carboxymuconolactone decarboxylase